MRETSLTRTLAVIGLMELPCSDSYFHSMTSALTGSIASS